MTTKKWESSEKRAVFKERHKYATQKNEKNVKHRETWRCYGPKYSLGGPGRPPQPEFASKITARRANFSGNSQPKLRFDAFLFFLFFCSFFFPIFCFFWRQQRKKQENSKVFLRQKQAGSFLQAKPAVPYSLESAHFASSGRLAACGSTFRHRLRWHSVQTRPILGLHVMHVDVDAYVDASIIIEVHGCRRQPGPQLRR